MKYVQSFRIKYPFNGWQNVNSGRWREPDKWIRGLMIPGGLVRNVLIVSSPSSWLLTATVSQEANKFPHFLMCSSLPPPATNWLAQSLNGPPRSSNWVKRETWMRTCMKVCRYPHQKFVVYLPEWLSMGDCISLHSLIFVSHSWPGVSVMIRHGAVASVIVAHNVTRPALGSWGHSSDTAGNIWKFLFDSIWSDACAGHVPVLSRYGGPL